jgi:hypothetical protein
MIETVYEGEPPGWILSIVISTSLRWNVLGGPLSESPVDPHATLNSAIAIIGVQSKRIYAPSFNPKDGMCVRLCANLRAGLVLPS